MRAEGGKFKTGLQFNAKKNPRFASTINGNDRMNKFFTLVRLSLRLLGLSAEVEAQGVESCTMDPSDQGSDPT